MRRLELVHRAPLLAEESAPVLLLLRTHGDACVEGELALAVAPPPAAATTTAAAALASPSAATTTAASAAAAAAAATPRADVPTSERGTVLFDEHGAPIGAPLPLPRLDAEATHAVALRLSTAAAGTLQLIATVRKP